MKSYIVVGLGRFGTQVAKKLYELGGEVLVLDTVNKNLGGDTEATFYIYKYKNESDLMAALKMTPDEIAGNDAYEYMGSGTVTLLDDKFAGMVNMKTMYIK